MDILAIKTIVAEKANEVNCVLAAMQHKLENCTLGELQTKKVNGALRVFESVDSSRKYIRANEKAHIKKLQEASYWRKLRKAAEEESRILQWVLKKLEDIPDTESVFAELPDEKKDLISPYKAGVSKKELEDWLKPLNWSKEVLSHDNCYTTLNGERVRSKSEVIIADRLKMLEIPYHYEYMKIIDSEKFWFPDFKVMNKRTGVEFYWEHFGRMDNPNYCDNTLTKLEKYSENGIVLGKNLIITMETSNHVLNTVYVDEIIRQYLL